MINCHIRQYSERFSPLFIPLHVLFPIPEQSFSSSQINPMHPRTQSKGLLWRGLLLRFCVQGSGLGWKCVCIYPSIWTLIETNNAGTQLQHVTLGKHTQTHMHVHTRIHHGYDMPKDFLHNMLGLPIVIKVKFLMIAVSVNIF